MGNFDKSKRYDNLYHKWENAYIRMYAFGYNDLSEVVWREDLKNE